MNSLQPLLNSILHIDLYLFSFVATYGMWTYLLLFAVIFCETALVITPFLPGDSLLFAAGSLAAHPSAPLNGLALFCLLLIASIIGNQLNYFIGRLTGPRVFSTKQSWLFNKNHLEKTHRFYERHGGKTIILARFMPIFRTFAPFIAGIGAMQISLFFFYNVISAFLWIGSLLSCGYFFGSLPLIKNNFSMVIYSIILISFLPPFFTFLYHKLSVKTSS